ncbi:hypothetical protein DMUE_3162 [Dictyocoela muelleri]|nr:hypothetical protein DMUE_3162 [Dictyocoela muelleri]
MILKYLGFLKCITIVLVCNGNLEFQIDDEDLKVYSGLRQMIGEINTRIHDIHTKRKMCYLVKSRIENIKIMKIITNFEIENIQIFTEIIESQNIPNSKNVNLKEILRLFKFFGKIENFYLGRFYEKIFHLLFLNKAAIIESPTPENCLIPEEMIRYIMNNFLYINISDFNCTPEDTKLISNIKLTEKYIILFNFLENQFYQKQFTLFLNSKDKDYYDDQFMNLISTQIFKFKEIAINLQILPVIFLNMLTKQKFFIENLDYLSLNINNNFSDQELDAISKFKNIKKLDILCNFVYLPDNLKDNMILKIPVLENLNFLRIFEFHYKNIDFSNLNHEKIETLALIECIYIENILFNQSLFPNLINLSISLTSYNLSFIDQISILTNNLTSLKSIAIFFQDVNVHEDKCLELIKSNKFNTNLIAFITSDKYSIFIRENNPNVNHSNFYDMIEIPNYQEIQFYGVTKFPDLQRHSKFNPDKLKFNNIVLLDFNFEIWNKYAFVKTFYFREVFISSKASDSLRKIENIYSLKFQSVIFENTNCFREIIEKNKRNIRVIRINETNLSFADASEILRIQNLSDLEIDQPEYTINNYETLLKHDFKNLGVIKIANGVNISRQSLYFLLNYKKLYYVRIKDMKTSVRNLLVTNAGEIYEYF